MGTSQLLGQLGEMLAGILQWVSIHFFLVGRGGGGVAAFLINSVSIFSNHDEST